MANITYNRFRTDLMKGNVDLDTAGDTITVALLKDSYTPDKDHDVWADVSASEADATSYSSQTLGSQTVTQDDSGDAAVFDGANTDFGNIGNGTNNSIGYIVLYTATCLICCIDTVSGSPSLPYTTNGGGFQVNWAATGIVRIT